VGGWWRLGGATPVTRHRHRCHVGADLLAATPSHPTNTHLGFRQHLVRCCQLERREHSSPFDTSMNFSCALSSGFTSGWYFLESFCCQLKLDDLQLRCYLSPLTLYARLMSDSLASLFTARQLATQPKPPPPPPELTAKEGVEVGRCEDLPKQEEHQRQHERTREHG
jgi:hypothetical protein